MLASGGMNLYDDLWQDYNPPEGSKELKKTLDKLWLNKYIYIEFIDAQKEKSAQLDWSGQPQLD